MGFPASVRSLSHYKEEFFSPLTVRDKTDTPDLPNKGVCARVCACACVCACMYNQVQPFLLFFCRTICANAWAWVIPRAPT